MSTNAMDAAAERLPEARLLRDALREAAGVDAGELQLVSREPLGTGSIAGFRTFERPQAAAAGATGTPGAASKPGTPSTPAAPEREVVYYVDTSGTPVPHETGLALGDPERPDARIWLHPADPHLPALAPAAFGEAASTLLARIGLHSTALPELVAYRPGRRAVLRAPHTQGTAWVKIVRPSRVDRIAGIHGTLRAHGLPTPEVLAWSPEGLLVLGEAHGAPADARDAPPPAALIDAIDALRTRLAAAPLGVPARASLSAQQHWYANRLADSLAGSAPAQALARDVAARARDALEAAPFAEGGAGVTVHGDLHLGQIFLGPDGAVTGLIDLDTAGGGDPADDSAAFLAHALASVAMAQEGAGSAGPDAARWAAIAAEASARWMPQTSRMRPLTAIHLLAHALGASEAGMHARATRLIESAARVLHEA